jgi:aminopeptidase N
MPMRNDQPVTFRRGDYQPSEYRIDRVQLEFDLDAERTLVTSTFDVRREPAGETRKLFRLDGEDLELVSVALDGQTLDPAAYELRDGGLTIQRPPDAFTLRVANYIRPGANTELMGLFISNGSFFTQCEAEGFRRITYFLDRPDVMARYRVTLRASKSAYPVLLANGNLVEQHDLDDGRHVAVWDDPYPKPSYLFALVAGRFVAAQSTWRRSNGREALLQVWVAEGDLDKAGHAMASLRHAIEWDERRFGLELDLDRFMIVASNDFNLGAMENKGLNIFNAKYVLANSNVATDVDHASIESIVGHEYFHNWTGNRVTCRDWFQLSLKEGLTVFRDQEFSADMQGEASSRAVKRIEDVRALRALQFPEDAGPMAHPVRPDSYQEISNFYTATVYEKGAEVVRMMQTLVGVAGFRRGMDLYFKRHDGQAVTCDDFVSAIADANGRDFSQFRRWYSQAGTPRVRAAGTYDPIRRTYELTLTQHTRASAGQPVKESFHIPFAVGLIDSAGRDLPLRLEGEAFAAQTTRVLELTQPTQSFRFVDVRERPVPSLLRNFSAPVIVEHPHDERELAFLACHDPDPFNRWEAGQCLAMTRLMQLSDDAEAGRPLVLDDEFVKVMATLLADDTLAPAFREQVLTLPAEGFIGEQRAVVDPEAIRAARRYVQGELGRRLAAAWKAVYDSHDTPGDYSPAAEPAGRRAFRNLALAYLVEGRVAGAIELAHRQLASSTNMTDRQAALAMIINSGSATKADVMVQLARAWQHEPLLMNKWYQLQATAMTQPGEPPVVDRVRRLLHHPGFSLANPNNVFALIRSFCMNNEAEFHRRGAAGYNFWAEQVLTLDRINPTIAARIARALDRWRKYTPDRQVGMRRALAQVASARTLSRDVREIVSKSQEQ